MSHQSRVKKSFLRNAEDVARRQRKIQTGIDRGRQLSKKPSKEPMQVGQRAYPAKFPKQHLKKPGNETDLEQPPMFEAPEYMGPDKLRDRVALITGGDSGIGRAIAVLCWWSQGWGPRGSRLSTRRAG